MSSCIREWIDSADRKKSRVTRTLRYCMKGRRKWMPYWLKRYRHSYPAKDYFPF
jgi:hypothetical protein